MYNDENPIEDYEELLHNLIKEWMSLESRHNVSKSAADDFWNLSKDWFPRLHRARINQMVYKPIPKLRYQRQKMSKNHVPPIHLEIGYLNKETNEMVVVRGDKTPTSRFNPMQFEKKYEAATVKVILTVVIYDRCCVKTNVRADVG